MTVVFATSDCDVPLFGTKSIREGNPPWSGEKRTRVVPVKCCRHIGFFFFRKSTVQSQCADVSLFLLAIDCAPLRVWRGPVPGGLFSLVAPTHGPIGFLCGSIAEPFLFVQVEKAPLLGWLFSFFFAVSPRRAPRDNLALAAHKLAASKEVLAI
nr:hypothetical protein [Pandoravirus belohorizontensis]